LEAVDEAADEPVDPEAPAAADPLAEESPPAPLAGGELAPLAADAGAEDAEPEDAEPEDAEPLGEESPPAFEEGGEDAEAAPVDEAPVAGDAPVDAPALLLLGLAPP